MIENTSNSLEGQAIGKYQVLKTIGRGNMGTVYLGQDPFVDRPVAIKVAADEYVNSSDDGPLYRRLFFNEAQAAGMLKHPNITAIFDAGVDQDRYYIVMEYVYGGTTLARFSNSEHLLSIKNLTDILYQCAMALDYAHREGVIHRDIKPKNILITDDLEAKITDFGVAIVPHLQEGIDPEHAGSPMYMAPEQLRLEQVTSQCDLFSLGIVAYELLTGNHPFEGRNMEAIQHRIQNTPPTPVHEFRADIPDIYQRIIDKALAKNTAHRYKSGADMAGDLSLVYDFIRLADGQPVQQEKFNRVKNLEFFAEFSDTELWEIVNAGDWLVVQVGDPIIREGEEDPSFYVLVDGEVSVLKSDVEIAKLGPGDCFGEMGITAGRRRTATINAANIVTALKVRSSIIQRTSINCQLRFQRQFLYTLIERLEYATNKIVDQSDAKSSE
ncbi:MAG: serine/threonine protein kinase [Gammaproteobacteria bacterium]|jgi:serine/threonine protein kinase